MNKSILIVVIIAVLLTIIAVAKKDKVEIKNCCQVSADQCASGPTVTKDACAEMDGVWSEGQDCNIETGRCE